MRTANLWVVKMELGDPSVSLDLLIRSLLALGYLERNINPTLALTNMILDVRAAMKGDSPALVPFFL